MVAFNPASGDRHREARIETDGGECISRSTSTFAVPRNSGQELLGGIATGVTFHATDGNYFVPGTSSASATAQHSNGTMIS